MSMFCYQCQEASKGIGCNIVGICGKQPETANLQDLLIYTVKGVSDIVVKGGLDAKDLGEVNHEVLKSLFMTITNANFDDAAFVKEINKMIALRDNLKAMVVAGAPAKIIKSKDEKTEGKTQLLDDLRK